MALSNSNELNLERGPENAENFEKHSFQQSPVVSLPSIGLPPLPSLEAVVVLRPDNKLIKRNLLIASNELNFVKPMQTGQSQMPLPPPLHAVGRTTDCKSESLQLDSVKEEEKDETTLFDANSSERGDVENSDPQRGGDSSRQPQQQSTTLSSTASGNNTALLHNLLTSSSTPSSSIVKVDTIQLTPSNNLLSNKQFSCPNIVNPPFAQIADCSQPNVPSSGYSLVPYVNLFDETLNDCNDSVVKTPSLINDDEFWNLYGPHNFSDQHDNFFENRTYRVYIGRYGDQLRVYKPLAVDRKTDTVIYKILGSYCDHFDSSVEDEVKKDPNGQWQDFIWPLSANRHQDNLKVIRRLIQDNPVPDRLPYVDLPSETEDLPTMPFSVRLKRKKSQVKPNLGDKKRKNSKKGKKRPIKSQKGTKKLDQSVQNRMPTSSASVSEFNEEIYSQARFRVLDPNEAMSDDEHYFSDNSNLNDPASLEKELEMLKDLSDSTEQELLTVATGLRRYRANRKRRNDSVDSDKSKRPLTTSKGVQPAHCPYCLQLFSATFNAKLHFNGRYKNNEKHISCKKRQEMGDQNLSPIICSSDCLICQVKNQTVDDDDDHQ